MHEAHANGPLDVRVEKVSDNVLVLHVSGRLDLPGTLVLRRVLRRTPILGHWVILDLAGAPEMAPNALVVLAKTQRGLHRQGGHLALRHLRAQPRRVLEQAAARTTFEVVDGELTDWLAARPVRVVDTATSQPNTTGRSRGVDTIDGAAVRPAEAS